MVHAYVTSAFSKDNKGGNKAGVVLNRPDLSREHKMALAKELGYSETAFILPCEQADFELQYYTPMDEVPLCGHATIASFSTLQILGMLEKQEYMIKTKAGILNVSVKPDGLVLMQQNKPEYYEILQPEVFERCFNKVLGGNLPVQIVFTGLRDVIFPVESQEMLYNLKPDFEELSRISRELGVVGLHVFALSKKPGLNAVCRNFAPLYGIDEESATGTANCALACYLHKHLEKKDEYVFEQGHTMGQASRILVELGCQGEEINSVYVGGYGYLVEEKTLHIS